MSQFFAYEVSLQVNQSLRPIHELLKRRNPDLADQLKRAACSVALNVAESNRRAGRDREHLLRVALGSASETKAALDLAACWGEVAAGDTEAVRVLLGRQVALLRGLLKPKKQERTAP